MNLWDFVKFIFSTPSPVAGPRATPSAPRPPQPPVKNPYEATGLLGLSAEELRRRAMRIRPWQTAWIGRVDTIPPISDERTAVIDRGPRSEEHTSELQSPCTLVCRPLLEKNM